MEKQGFASLWIGNIDSQVLLDEYTGLIYTDKGECLPSYFLIDFNIDMDDFEEDFIETVFHMQNVKVLKDLIIGCSYEDIVIPKFINILGNKLPNGINAAILLYNFEYNGDIKEIKKDKFKFMYIGTTSYTLKD